MFKIIRLYSTSDLHRPTSYCNGLTAWIWISSIKARYSRTVKPMQLTHGRHAVVKFYIGLMPLYIAKETVSLI